MEAFFDYLRTRRPGKPLAVSTARNYQNDLRLFLDYVTDARYGWPTTCSERFDRAPVQLLHEWNTVTHTSEYEGAAERRPLTYDEVQALFDAADGRVEAIRKRRRKGSLAALRDAMVLKAVYAYGLRRQEAGSPWHRPRRRGPGTALWISLHAAPRPHHPRRDHRRRRCGTQYRWAQPAFAAQSRSTAARAAESKRGALDYQPDSQHNTVALPRPGTRTTHPVRIPRPTATTSRLRRPRQPQQRPSCPGLRPAGIRPRRPHRHKHQQRHTVDRIRQTRLARLHRVPHADLTAPRSTAMDQRDHHELGAVIAPLHIRRQMRRADE